MAIDFEYSVEFGSIDLVQVAMGQHLFIFDTFRNHSPLMEETVNGELSLRYWLQSPRIIKVAQACAGDCRLLRGYGINCKLIFDTAAADATLRRTLSMACATSAR